MSESAFYLLEPEVPGGLGDDTVVEHHPDGPRVLSLHYEFAAGCQGDELATSHPVFIVSERVGAILARDGLSGFTLAPMTQSIEPQAYELEPELSLPTYAWLQVHGIAGEDDFGIADAELIVSEQTLRTLQAHARLSLCEIEAWAAEPRQS